MARKIVGAGRLNRAHLLHEVGSKYSQIRLMLVDERGELETVHRLLRTQRIRQLDKTQQTSSKPMGDKQGQERSTALDGYQRRPVACRALAEVGCQPMNGRMFEQHGVGELGTEPLLDLH